MQQYEINSSGWIEIWIVEIFNCWSNYANEVHLSTNNDAINEVILKYSTVDSTMQKWGPFNCLVNSWSNS